MPASVVEGQPPAFRRAWQAGFFLLFALAPVVDLFRLDLSAGHAWIFGQPWRLGIDDFVAGRIDALTAGQNLLLRLFLPLLAAAFCFLGAAWRWGRLYCGWLCPHFSAVESINRLMQKACGRQSLWDRIPAPPRRADGSLRRQHPAWWGPTLITALLLAFVWAVVLLTYLLPPREIYRNLWHLAPTANQTLFLAVATALLTAEFLFARHLFCRFGCAVGLFQSLVWMSNRAALVVGFDRDRAATCQACYGIGGPGDAACETACPMRLRPRQAKHKMFACTQCTQCIDACGTVQQQVGQLAVLRWVERDEARQQEAQVSLTGRRD